MALPFCAPLAVGAVAGFADKFCRRLRRAGRRREILLRTEERIAPSRAPGLLQRERIPCVIDIDLLVGQHVRRRFVRTPAWRCRACLARMTLRIEASSAMARYTGFGECDRGAALAFGAVAAGAVIGVQRGEVHDLFGARTSESVRGWPWGAPQPATAMTIAIAAEMIE